MKLLFISEYFPASSKMDFYGGIESRIYHTAKYLAKNNYVTIFASYEKNKPKYQVLNNMRIYRLGLPRNYSRSGDFMVRISFIFCSFIKGLLINFDLVEGSSFLGWFPAYLLAKLKRTKKTVVIADLIKYYVTDSSKIFLSILKNIEYYILNKNWDAKICISKTVRNKLVLNHICTDNVKIIYCGVDIKLIKSIKSNKKEYPEICVVSRLVHYKRIKDLILALFIIRKSIKKIKLNIIGTGDDSKYLFNLVKKMKLGKYIRFYGHIRDYRKLISILKQSWIFCLPSVVEGFGIATVEAMAAELPVVLADIQVNHEITNNLGSLFFKPKNSADLAKKITFLLNNKSLIRKLSRQAGKMAMNYYSIKLAQQTKKLYADLCFN